MASSSISHGPFATSQAFPCAGAFLHAITRISCCMSTPYVAVHACTSVPSLSTMQARAPRLVQHLLTSGMHLSGVVPFRKGMQIGFDWTSVSVSNPKCFPFVVGFPDGFRRRPFRSRHVARAPLVRHLRARWQLAASSEDGGRRGEEGRTPTVHPSDACVASVDPRLTHASGRTRAAADLRKCHGVRRRERIRRVCSGGCTSLT